MVLYAARDLAQRALAGEVYKSAPQRRKSEPLCTVEDLRWHLKTGAQGLRNARNYANSVPLQEAVFTLEGLAVDSGQIDELENLERRLKTMEDQIVAALRAGQTQEDGPLFARNWKRN
jgi:hypothetical protein